MRNKAFMVNLFHRQQGELYVLVWEIYYAKGNINNLRTLLTKLKQKKLLC